MESEGSSPRQQIPPLILILGQKKASNSTSRVIFLREKLDNPGQEYKHFVLVIIFKEGASVYLFLRETG
jgi:hypothetical protein